MSHIPHLYLPGPWESGSIEIDEGKLQHLHRVLRLSEGADLDYTDGRGQLGRGTLERGHVVRGDESPTLPPPDVSVYLAPPKSRDRQRFAVEKLAELGVRSVGWLRTVHTEGRPVKPQKAAAWAVSALEQSRGTWLTEVEGQRSVADVAAGGGTVVAADRDGIYGPIIGYPVILLVGPEAGWAPEEIAADMPKVALARTILRVETAAVIGAASLMSAHHRK